MTPSGLIRASGLASLTGGVMFALFPVLHPDHSPAAFSSATWVPIHLMPNIGAILVLFGLVGLLARQLDRAGRTGVVAFIVAFLGTASFVMGTMIEAFIIPWAGLQSPELLEGPPAPGVGEAFMVITTLFSIGYLLLGAATLRAGVLPRGVGMLLLVAALALLVVEPLVGSLGLPDALWALGPLLLGVGIAYKGYALWSQTPAFVGSRLVQPARPRTSAA